MFCVKYYPFHSSTSYLNQVEELRITYNPKDMTLQNFVKEHSHQTIIIELNEAEEYDIIVLKHLSKNYQNIKLIINYNNTAILNMVREMDIPFFFSNYLTTTDEIHGLLPYHPTDMYICEDLGFHLDQLSVLLHEKNIKIRVIPNICQSKFPETNSLKSFFIRPEDISIYSVFVDVFELVCETEAAQAILYKAYKTGEWFGPLKEIIPNFNCELDGRFIFSSFGMIRSKCHKKCGYNPNVCKICNRFMELSETLQSNNLMVKRVRKHKEFKQKEE